MLAPAALIEYGATIKYFRRACPELVEQGWEQSVTRHGRAGWDEVPLSSPKGRHTVRLAGTLLSAELRTSLQTTGSADSLHCGPIATAR
jgi:hypothetical protein